MTPKKKAVRSSKRRNVASIGDYAHLIPKYAKVLAGLTDVELRGAPMQYLSATFRAESIDAQARYICLAIAAHAAHMRGVHTAWRHTLPLSIEHHARLSGLDATYIRDDLRALCGSAIEQSWPEIARGNLADNGD